MNEYEGTLESPGGRFAIVASRFNSEVVERLVRGAFEGWQAHGVPEEAIDLVWVPGAFEIPVIAQQLAQSRRYAAVVALGAVIRGETDHYEHVAHAVAAGVRQAAQSTGIPVLFGVLTCATVEQALARAGAKSDNKGFEAAEAALAMVNLLRKLPGK